ncbi:MAG: hypothetical protein ABFR35_10300 [Thermodesulfobacteriota bacterium]
MIDQEQTVTRQGHRHLKPKAKYSPPEECKVELFAEIKKSSEYYHQGLDQNGKPRIFRVDDIGAGFLCFRLNSNRYSNHDLAFYVKDVKGNLIPLAGGMSK